MSDLVAKTLYRSLLRTTKQYSCEKTGPILCSLLYRSGSDDYMDYDKLSPPPPPPPRSSSLEGEHEMETSTSAAQSQSTSSPTLSSEEARDLSKSYAELKDNKKEQDQMMHHHYQNEGWNTVVQKNLPEQHIILYKRLLREVLGSKNHMNFPLHVKTTKVAQADGDEDQDHTPSTVMSRLKDVLRREFQSHGGGYDEDDVSLSKSYTEKQRTEAAFLSLRELQKKLAWADSLGLFDDESLERSPHVPHPVQHVTRLPTQPPSSYLKSGTFLIAHPLLTGCFAQSVICILEHTEPIQTSGQRRDIRDVDADLLDDDETDTHEHGGDNVNVNEYQPSGGTYGIIINKPLKTGVPHYTSTRQRDRTLREVIRNDCLPTGVKTVFGDSRVKNGGPVNMTVQMMRYATVEKEEKVKIGGSVLSPRIMGEEENDDDDGEVKSTAMYTDTAVYYGGDIIKASQAVIDGDMQKESFSFVVGASCWEPGQLENEIERGYWVPCAGPLQNVFSGSSDVICDDPNEQKVASASNLWTSIMYTLGEDEGRFANIIQNNEYNENGLPCDEV